MVLALAGDSTTTMFMQFQWLSGRMGLCEAESAASCRGHRWECQPCESKVNHGALMSVLQPVIVTCPQPMREYLDFCNFLPVKSMSPFGRQPCNQWLYA